MSKIFALIFVLAFAGVPALSGCGASHASDDFSISANPATLSLPQGGTGTSTIPTTVTSGTAESIALTMTGVPAGATASLSPTTVSAGGSSTLTVSAGTAAAGSYTLTVIGAAASATHATSVTFTVNGPPLNDFSISANPATLSLLQGGRGGSTISTTVTRGTAESTALTVTGVPAGATASLSPTTVSAGGSSTLTVNTGTAALGSYTLTIIGAAASATHATSVALTVN